MSASFSVDSYGLQDALKKMQKIDPALRRAVLKDIKLAAQPLVTAINNRIPAQAPLKGMNHSGRTGWKNVKKVQVSLNTRKPRGKFAGNEQIAVVRIVTKGAPVAIVDMAGKAGGTSSRREAKYQRPKFASALGGSPSRFVWKDVESMIGAAEKALTPIIQKVMDDASKDFK
jgi:hypothetical protein